MFPFSIYGPNSIYTEITKPGQLENKLSIANATINDGGNYTCSLDSFSVSIVVHFLKGNLVDLVLMGFTLPCPH